MTPLKKLLQNNQKWSERRKIEDPEYFENLSKQQTPEYLWIGCSDSRVPANEIVGLMPGELFVHRNIANLVIHTDLNCLSVLEYAVVALKVKHIIVCGHYGCGGVAASMGNKVIGAIDNWLRNIKDIYQRNYSSLSKIEGKENQVNRLCELNVVEQVSNICVTTIVQQAWKRGQELSVSGWIYDIRDGVLKDLNLHVNSLEHVSPIYRIE